MNTRCRTAFATALVLLFTGCATQMQHNTPSAIGEERSQSISAQPGEGVSQDTKAPMKRPIDVDRSSPGEISQLIAAVGPEGSSVVPMTSGEPASIVASEPNGPLRAIMGILIYKNELSVYTALLTPDATVSSEGTLEPIVTGITIDEVRPIAIVESSDTPNGFSLIVHDDTQTFTYFVILTKSGTYSIRTPLSPVGRSVLRNLSGSAANELVQYSRVFEAGGRREVIVDSFSWAGDSFVHDRSLAILRQVNERLRRLERSLESDRFEIEILESAFTAATGAPPIPTLLPAEDVIVPELVELLVELGSPEWTIGHEIAILDDQREPQVYGIQLRIVANPYSETPVTIIGLD